MRLRRLIRLVCVIVGVETAFYAVVAPLLPRYADELSLSKLSAGLLTAAYPAGVLLGSLPAGALCARIGPKRTVIAGVGLVAVSSVVFGHVHSIAVLDLTRLMQGVGGSCAWAGGLAWIVAEAPAERRGELIGAAMGSAIAGSLFGPVLGAVAQASSPALVFTGVGALAAALGLQAMRTPASPAAPTRILDDTKRALKDTQVRVGMWLVALPALAFGAITVLGSLRLDDLGFGGTAVAATFLVCSAIEASESPLIGRVSDRRGRIVPIRVGLAAASVVLLLVALPQTALLLAAAIAAATAALGVFWAPAMAMLSDAAESTGVAQGIAFALMNLAWGTGSLVGSSGGGALAKLTSDAVVLGVCAAGCAMTLALVATRARETATA